MNISKYIIALLAISLALFLGACARGNSGAEQSAAGLRAASSEELRKLSPNLKVEILRTNTDSLGNTRLVAKIENTSNTLIGKAEVTFRDAGDAKTATPVGQAEVGELIPNEPITVSVPTAIGADDIVARDLQREVTKIWLTR